MKKWLHLGNMSLDPDAIVVVHASLKRISSNSTSTVEHYTEVFLQGGMRLEFEGPLREVFLEWWDKQCSTQLCSVPSCNKPAEFYVDVGTEASAELLLCADHRYAATRRSPKLLTERLKAEARAEAKATSKDTDD